MNEVQNPLDDNQKKLLNQLEILMRNCAYIMITMSILTFFLGFLSTYNYIFNLSLEDLIKLIYEDRSDLEFMVVIDTFVTPFFVLFLGIYVLKSCGEIQRIFNQESEEIEHLFKSLFYLKRFFRIFYIEVIVFIILVWFKMIFF